MPLFASVLKNLFPKGGLRVFLVATLLFAAFHVVQHEYFSVVKSQTDKICEVCKLGNSSPDFATNQTSVYLHRRYFFTPVLRYPYIVIEIP